MKIVKDFAFIKKTESIVCVYIQNYDIGKKTVTLKNRGFNIMYAWERFTRK